MLLRKPRKHLNKTRRAETQNVQQQFQQSWITPHTGLGNTATSRSWSGHGPLSTLFSQKSYMKSRAFLYSVCLSACLSVCLTYVRTCACMSDACLHVCMCKAAFFDWKVATEDVALRFKHGHSCTYRSLCTAKQIYPWQRVDMAVPYLFRKPQTLNIPSGYLT